MSDNFIISLIIYPYDVMVSIGETDKELKKKLKEYAIYESKDLYQYSSINNCAKAVCFKNGQCLIRITNKPITPIDFGNLQHEIFHVTTFIMERVGMKLKIEVSDEAYAYLIGYLTKMIYEKIFGKII